MFSKLPNIKKGKPILLKHEKIKQLKTLTNFTSVRIFCRKPSTGRTVHIILKDRSEYIAGMTDEYTNYCDGRIQFLPDDTSILGQEPDCTKLLSHYRITRLYGEIIYTYVGVHVLLELSDRLECDDFYVNPGFDDIGVWYYYVR